MIRLVPLVLVVLGVTAALIGLSLYDMRLGLIVGGTLLAVVGLLVDPGEPQ